MATKRRRSGFFLLAALVLLSACGEPPRWVKPGGDDMSVQRDLSACRQQAQAMFGAPTGLSSSPMSPRFGPVDPSPADRAMQESQAVGSCMRGKGYILRAADTQ
jgi:hypothetical protein